MRVKRARAHNGAESANPRLLDLPEKPRSLVLACIGAPQRLLALLCSSRGWAAQNTAELWRQRLGETSAAATEEGGEIGLGCVLLSAEISADAESTGSERWVTVVSHPEGLFCWEGSCYEVAHRERESENERVRNSEL